MLSHGDAEDQCQSRDQDTRSPILFNSNQFNSNNSQSEAKLENAIKIEITHPKT